MNINTSKIINVAVGIAAYNEEANINQCLQSICEQSEKYIKITEIIVMSDGSTDNTVSMAKSINDHRIKVIDDGERRGKPSRVNQLLQTFSGDILVIIDADMITANQFTIEKIAAPFLKNPQTDLVGGNVKPVKATTFIESAINNYVDVRDSMKNEFDFGATAYGPHAFLAYGKKFARSLVVPDDILSDDAYSYFYAIEKGYRYSYAVDAKVLYRSPQTIKDHLSQSTRHLYGSVQLYPYFGKETVDKGFSVPKKVQLKLAFKQFINNPLGYIVLKSLNLYCITKVKFFQKKIPVRWETVSSSKKLNEKIYV